GRLTGRSIRRKRRGVARRGSGNVCRTQADGSGSSTVASQRSSTLIATDTGRPLAGNTALSGSVIVVASRGTKKLACPDVQRKRVSGGPSHPRNPDVMPPIHGGSRKKIAAARRSTPTTSKRLIGIARTARGTD